MGMCKSVSIEELQKDNKRMCLSALRVFGKCDECEVIKRYYQDQARIEPRGVKPCESAVFSKTRLEYLEKKKILRDKINTLEKEYQQLKEEYN